jgi:hypothetical protein
MGVARQLILRGTRRRAIGLVMTGSHGALALAVAMFAWGAPRPALAAFSQNTCTTTGTVPVDVSLGAMDFDRKPEGTPNAAFVTYNNYMNSGWRVYANANVLYFAPFVKFFVTEAGFFTSLFTTRVLHGRRALPNIPDRSIAPIT